jgi:hypothetical protein
MADKLFSEDKRFMTDNPCEEIPAGDTVSIENSQSSGLQISVRCDSGSRFDIELSPGQILGFSAGDEGAKIFLHEGDPASLLIIKPETAA